MERKYLFDKVAHEYDKIRPKYPKEVFQDIIAYSNLKSNDPILEIGCGTGQATESFVGLGFDHITGIELGKELSKITSEKFKEHEDVKIHNIAFEEWAGDANSFDLAISATAFHWVDQKIGYNKVGELLRKDGSMAFFWTHHVPGEGKIFDEISDCYQKYAPHLDYMKSNPAEYIIQERTKSINESGLFKDLEIKRYNWFDKYTSDEYVSLFNTNSAHQALDPDVREKLFHDIKKVIESHGNEIMKPQFVISYMARKA